MDDEKLKKDLPNDDLKNNGEKETSVPEVSGIAEEEKMAAEKTADAAAAATEDIIDSFSSDDEQDDSEWKFDGEVNTDIEKIEMTYNGKEIDIPDVANGKSTDKADKDEVVITIDKAKVRRNMKIVMIAILTVIIGVLVFFAVKFTFISPNSNEIMLPANSAMKVDGTNISVGEYNYFYGSLTNENRLTSYESYYGLDTSKPYEEQYYDEAKGITWLNFFENTTVDQIKNITYLSNKAKDEGIKLNDTQKKNIDTQLATIKKSAATAKKSVGDYIKESYGENVGVKTIKKIMTDDMLAQAYNQKMLTETRFTADEVKTYADANMDKLETTSFKYLPFEFTPGDEAAINDAKTKADAFANALTDTATFLEVAKNHASADYQQYLDDEYTLMTGVTKSHTGIPSSIIEWLYTDSTKVNSKTVIRDDDSGCFFVIMMNTEPGLDTTMEYTVRHSLTNAVSATASPDDATGAQTTTAALTDDDWNTALTKAQGVYDEFNATDKSEASFAAIAEKHSDDVASTSSGTNGSYGGIYDEVSIGEMVPEFEAWAMDSARRYGDTELVKSKFGYHLMYFVNAQEKWRYSAEKLLINDKNVEMIAGINAEKKGAFDKCKVASASALVS